MPDVVVNEEVRRERITPIIRALERREATLSPPRTKRSEERRVGKECRSLCDWSSDVCSSDLNARCRSQRGGAEGANNPNNSRPGTEGGDAISPAHEEIGRASCRERV